MATSISFIFDQDIELSPTEIWPNGDVPHNITAEVILQEVHKAGGLERILHDWNLMTDMDLTVVVNDDGDRSTMTYHDFVHEVRKAKKEPT